MHNDLYISHSDYLSYCASGVMQAEIRNMKDIVPVSAAFPEFRLPRLALCLCYFIAIALAASGVMRGQWLFIIIAVCLYFLGCHIYGKVVLRLTRELLVLNEALYTTLLNDDKLTFFTSLSEAELAAFKNLYHAKREERAQML